MSGESFEDAMARVRAKYVARMRTRVVYIRDVLENISVGDPLSGNQLEEIRNVCHGYKGSGYSYGFENVSVLGGKAEDAVKAAMDGDDGELADALAALAEELEAVISRS